MSVVATTDDVDAKILSTLQARAALAGYELVQLGTGEFIVSKFGLFRTLDHIAAVETFLQRVRAPNG